MEADTISGQRYDDDAGARGGGDGVDALFGRRVRLLLVCRYAAAARRYSRFGRHVAALYNNHNVTHSVVCAPHASLTDLRRVPVQVQRYDDAASRPCTRVHTLHLFNI